MPTLKQALVKPNNIGERIEVAAPRAQIMPPPIPDREGGLSIGSLGPTPAAFTTPYDSVRQWVRPGVSQSRFPTLPTKANPQLNAAARTVAAQVVAASKKTP
jgi:hypothetical protein